eukprot:717138-Pyramimonas_sp.AAC.2
MFLTIGGISYSVPPDSRNLLGSLVCEQTLVYSVTDCAVIAQASIPCKDMFIEVSSQYLYEYPSG